jgi:hypothetical protein
MAKEEFVYYMKSKSVSNGKLNQVEGEEGRFELIHFPLK